MWHRKRFFITKSDLLFAVLLALAIWLGFCWYIGSTNYRLTYRLEEQILVSGVVRTTEPSLPEFNFAYSSNTGSGERGGPYYSDRERSPSVADYELMLPGARVHGYYRSGEWEQDDRVSGEINLSIEAPAGWRAEPPDHTISGPRSDADFDLIRETQ